MTGERRWSTDRFFSASSLCFCILCRTFSFECDLSSSLSLLSSLDSSSESESSEDEESDDDSAFLAGAFFAGSFFLAGAALTSDLTSAFAWDSDTSSSSSSDEVASQASFTSSSSWAATSVGEPSFPGSSESVFGVPSGPRISSWTWGTSSVFSPSSGFFFCILRLSIALDGFSFFSPIWGTSIPCSLRALRVASILARAVFCALVSRRPSAFALSLLSFSFCFLRSLRSCSCFNFSSRCLSASSSAFILSSSSCFLFSSSSFNFFRCS
uniref:Uncharacterized protein n=1 Tax=Ixodes ricinus TaxID=34613 RepID=A0A6B0V885_IXORI